ncbi:unnamed protein product [Didymodactylos carnosus]|uniref:Uncharacterized protein n=1 Tax=Didymodactylos carnosus TaxID=1234261 RepID=A0A8S2J1P1_9BILA|nr:unnamed protein product [Didymodactylos carnosus]CAF3790281.1 unnamed protein product [Didymodactylos carnosus]
MTDYGLCDLKMLSNVIRDFEYSNFDNRPSTQFEIKNLLTPTSIPINICKIMNVWPLASQKYQDGFFIQLFPYARSFYC